MLKVDSWMMFRGIVLSVTLWHSTCSVVCLYHLQYVMMTGLSSSICIVDLPGLTRSNSE